ncbi:hypothetical protein DFS33DRAFT_388010 [Desarmillaria ectypa]|nr:hypothetical protein DFS33DRAFT_388010 [Desarmillaria ectypa]
MLSFRTYLLLMISGAAYRDLWSHAPLPAPVLSLQPHRYFPVHRRIYGSKSSVYTSRSKLGRIPPQQLYCRKIECLCCSPWRGAAKDIFGLPSLSFPGANFMGLLGLPPDH